jgi:hypothetical protein
MTGVALRKGTYYYRQRIPAELVAVFGCKHFRRTLGTKDIRAATMLGSQWAAKTQAAFAVIRSGALPPTESKAIAANLLRLNLGDFANTTHPTPPQATNSANFTNHLSQNNSIAPVMAPLTLGLLIERFVDENLTRQKWTEKTHAENLAILNF